MIEQVFTHYGRIDILINNAGQAAAGTVAQVSPDDYRQIIELNLFGPLYAIQAAVPKMRQGGGGLIINISSMVTKMHIPGLAAYASTKSALNMLSDTACVELAPDNIRVITVYPAAHGHRFRQEFAGGSACGSANASGMPTTRARSCRHPRAGRRQDPGRGAAGTHRSVHGRVADIERKAHGCRRLVGLHRRRDPGGQRGCAQRKGLRGSGLALIVAGFVALGCYGLVVNIVRWDFSRLLGVYVAVFAVISVLAGRVVFRENVPVSTWIGLAVIVAGGLIIQFGAGLRQ